MGAAYSLTSRLQSQNISYIRTALDKASDASLRDADRVKRISTPAMPGSNLGKVSPPQDHQGARHRHFEPDAKSNERQLVNDCTRGYSGPY